MILKDVILTILLSLFLVTLKNTKSGFQGLDETPASTGVGYRAQMIALVCFHGFVSILLFVGFTFAKSITLKTTSKEKKLHPSSPFNLDFQNIWPILASVVGPESLDEQESAAAYLLYSGMLLGLVLVAIGSSFD